jgi:hypothetical protein
VTVANLDHNGIPWHVVVPVQLTGTTADLHIAVHIKGLNKFATHSGGGYGAWSCAAITPMAGNGKTATLSCSLPNASPSDVLDLGLDIGYVGDATLTADASVESAGGDSVPSNNVVSIALPPPH